MGSTPFQAFMRLTINFGLPSSTISTTYKNINEGSLVKLRFAQLQTLTSLPIASGQKAKSYATGTSRKAKFN